MINDKKNKQNGHCLHPHWAYALVRDTDSEASTYSKVWWVLWQENSRSYGEFISGTCKVFTFFKMGSGNTFWRNSINLS